MALSGCWCRLRRRIEELSRQLCRSCSAPSLRDVEHLPTSSGSRAEVTALSGTALSAASEGRQLIMTSVEAKPLHRLRIRAPGTRNTRPIRKQAVSSRRSTPRP